MSPDPQFQTNLDAVKFQTLNVQRDRALSPVDKMLSDVLVEMRKQSFATGSIDVSELMTGHRLSKVQMGALLNLLDRSTGGTHPASNSALAEYLSLEGRTPSSREIGSLADRLESLGVAQGLTGSGSSALLRDRGIIELGMPGAPLTRGIPKGAFGKLLKIADVAEMITDVIGIFDPTPCSDIVGGIIALCKGDFIGAALSGVSAFPGVGDALAKPAKFARHLAKIAEAFPALKWMKHADVLEFIWKGRHLGAAGLEEGFKLLSRCKGNVKKALGIIEQVGQHVPPNRLAEIVGKISNLGDAEQIAQTVSKLSKYGKEKVANCLEILSRQKEEAIAMYRKNPALANDARRVGLPTNGPVVFVPPKGKSNIAECFSKEKGGYVDAHGNVWKQGVGTSGSGAAKEWDVQVGQGSLKALAGDGKHLNVSKNKDNVGVITHIPSV